jgi:poly(beta-D-mannuronate) lyase
VLLEGAVGETFVWAGDFAWGFASLAHLGIRRADPRLDRSGDGLSRPAPSSPVRDAAGAVAVVKTDIDGQPRGGRSDAGCDEMTDGPVTNRPLSAADVGTSWRVSGRP